MKRSKRGIDAVAWLVGLGLPALLLLGVFSTLPYERMAGAWPLGMENEVAFYQERFDLRDAPDSAARAEQYEIHARMFGPDDGKWHRVGFNADGWEGGVEIRRMRTRHGGWIVKFPKDSLFRTQRQIALWPASPASIRHKYEEILATELGLVTPEVSYVHVSSVEDGGLFVKEERIDAGFLEKRRITDGALFTQGFSGRPDQRFPEMDNDTLAGPVIADIERELAVGDDPWRYMAPEEAAGYLMMLAIADRTDLLLDEGLYVYRWTTGKITPLYRARRNWSAEIAHRPHEARIVQQMIRDAAFLEHVRERKVKLEEQIWKLKERFVALDQAWLPVLAGSGGLPLAQAEADRIKEELFSRIRSLDLPATFASPPPPIEPVQFADHGAGALPEPHDRATLADLLEGEWIGDSLVLRRGKREIMQDLIFPVGAALVLEKSVRLELAPGRSVLVQGPVIVRGTGVNPVFIRPLREDSAFGAFAVSMDGNGRCELRGLLISGGSESRISGRYHSGMLSIHGATAVFMEDCMIGGSHGEDALNIKRGNVLIRDCVFEDGYADLVDLDFVKGSVTGCSFRNGRSDSNGDGLDLSGSHVLVTECDFTHMLDKGVSVGEVSEVLITACDFTRNTLGVAAKDLSIAYVDDCTFTDNGTVVAAYRKKPIYGGARLFTYNNTFIGNAREREVDTLSAVVQRQALEERVRSSFGLAP